MNHEFQFKLLVLFICILPITIFKLLSNKLEYYESSNSNLTTKCVWLLNI